MSNNNSIDNSNNSIDISYTNVINIIQVSDISLNSEIGPGYVIDVSNNEVKFNTTQQELHVPNITENLSQNIVIINDNELLVSQIRICAAQIKCDNFHGKGSIDDYNELFAAAAEIANQTKTIELDVNINGFNEFATAADELSNLFQSFTTKLQTVNIIDDSKFLTSILNALQKIVNLSNNFAKFKETILATSTIEIPQSIYTTAIIINEVSDEVDCAMQYINNFVTPNSNLQNAELSSADKLIIHKATTTINSWNSIVEHGVSVTMAENQNMKYIKQQNTNYIERASLLRTTTTNLRNKFNFYNL